MAATANAAQLLLDGTSPRIVPPTITVDFANVTGTTKPADNATVNRVTYSASAPPSPVNGDIWVDTTSMPYILKTRVGGAWVPSGNYVTSTSHVTDDAGLGFTANWAGITGTGKPSNNADVTTTILGASGTSIVMTAANLFKSGSGLGGVFIGSGGLFGKNSSGVTTFSIDGTTGAAVFKGDISGGANIDITGNAKFGGAVTSGSFTYAGLFNASGGAQGGIKAFGGSGAAVWGSNSGAGVGVKADSGSGIGVDAFSGSGTAVKASSSGGVALNCDGDMQKTNTNLVANLNAEYWGSMKVTGNTTGTGTGTYVSSNKPGGSTSNTWLVINIVGTAYYIPIWT